MVMCLRFAGILVGGLLCLAGPALSEPVADRDTRTLEGEVPEVWGDSEDSEKAERGWTWFGMGYERRSRAATTTSAGESQGPRRAQQAGGGKRGGAGK